MLFVGSRRPMDRIATSFRWLQPRPFASTEAASYSAGYGKGGYALSLHKDSCFAWEALQAGRSFEDAIVEADVEIDPSNGHSAAGILFRQVDDENFYSFLISTRGNFRVDLLFNAHPMRIVEWTAAPAPDDETGRGAPAFRSLRVIAHGSRLSFQVDDEWVAEVEDEVLPSGGVGFTAQNFAGSGPGVFRLRRILVEARPLEVEREHLRWWYYAPVSPASRLRLAETLFSTGSFPAAAVQLRKALKDRKGSARERFLLAECYAKLSLHNDALEELDVVLALEPSHPGARLERANLLYLSNRLLEARDSLASGFAQGSIESSAPGAWNLLGNAEYGLGNWDKAAEAYGRAIDLQPEMPLFLANAARALERAGRRVDAVTSYLRAARLLFAEEAFDELSAIVPRLRALAPADPEAVAMEAKMLYREGRSDEALALLRTLEDDGSTDSAVHYILGLILSSRGEREAALARLARAAELEPEYPLYHFRLAETLHALGRDPRPALDRARALDPRHAWANNLEGQLRLEQGDPASAVGPLTAAREAAPAEIDIGLNLSEALSLTARHSEALETLARLQPGSRDGARVANQRGNVLARAGDPARAAQEYEAAIRQDPATPAYKENCAAACIELDMVHRAEELLAQVEPDHPSPSVYNLLGQVAVLKGERARAEAAYAAGLARAPGHPDLTVNLALLLRERGRVDAARELLAGFLSAHRGGGSARARDLLDRIRAESDRRICCASCGRQWWAPKQLPPQPALRIRGEPPADAPAGQCPQCAKVYCVGCASSHVRELRFVCPEHGEALRLADDGLKWLLARALEAAESGARDPPANPSP